MRDAHTEDSDVQEGLLEEEREAEGAERADLQAAASGSEPASTGPAQLTTLESFILFITKGLAACATSLQACVQWIVTGSSSLPLTDEQLELVAKVRAVLKERFDRNNPEHQVRAAFCLLPLTELTRVLCMYHWVSDT
jgi:hypothetical protein